MGERDGQVPNGKSWMHNIGGISANVCESMRDGKPSLMAQDVAGVG